MPISWEELADIKSKQYVLITRAGLSILSSKMDSKTIFKSMFDQFDCHVKRIKLPQGLAKNAYYRTSRHLDETVTEKEIHDGKLFRKEYSAIKKYVNNKITPHYVKLLGQMAYLHLVWTKKPF